MGLFGLFGRKAGAVKGRGKHGPHRSAEERRKARYEAAMRQLKKENPQRALEITLAEMGQASTKEHPLEEVAKTVKMMKSLGFWPKDNEDVGRGGSELAEILKEIAPTAMGQHIGQAIGFLMARAGGLPAEAAVQNTTPAPQLQQLAPPIPTQGCIQIQQPDGKTQQPEGEMSLVSAYVLSEFQKRDPKAAANWLLSLPYPQIQQVVPVLCSTENSQLPHVMAQLGQAWPDIAPTCNWLLSQPTYLNGLIAALREAMPKGEEEEKPHRGL